ncbi:MAG: helix-turn-helix domain-containing protein [Vicingus serpentipes]|nr:helix-turn-helix domain-containing protein [Vicingus serpentipes]
MEELDALQQDIAQNLRKLRKANNLTYKQAAKVLGISLTQYTRLEGGQANASIVAITRAAVFYKVSISEIVFGEKPKQEKKPTKLNRNKSLKEKIKEIEKLSKKDKEMAYELIELLIIKNQLDDMENNSSPSDH